MNMQAQVYFCPRCGSTSLELPAFPGGNVDCKACDWQGVSRDLLTTSFTHEHGTDTELIKRFMGELRVTLARDSSKGIGLILHKWGFIDTMRTGGGEIINPDSLSRYMTAISKATLEAILTVREELEAKKNESRH